MAQRRRVVDIDRGYNDFAESILEVEAASVDIGLLKDKFPDPKDVMHKGVFSEYGARFSVTTSLGETYQQTIPARPTHRPMFDQNWRRYVGIMVKHMTDPTRMDLPELIKFLGKLHALRVRRAIRTLKNPPNAPMTIARKEALGISPPDDPLIETGDLSRDIDWRYNQGRLAPSGE